MLYIIISLYYTKRIFKKNNLNYIDFFMFVLKKKKKNSKNSALTYFKE